MAVEKSRRARLVAKFRQQVKFLERSCSAYDGGEEDEAIRIATSLRILFHNTGKCSSLVKLLELSTRKMLTSAKGNGDWRDYLKAEIDFGRSEPIKMLPVLGEAFREVPLERWWENEPVYVLRGDPHTRKDIILSATNKDGGAHVDEELDEYYESLCAGVNTIGITPNLEFVGTPLFAQGVTHYPKNMNLALIRQFAQEALASIWVWEKMQRVR